ncbi:MAG TPA: thiol-disulfide isomerase [Verrucomicrobiae bacterium]|nr:thiol-disulfide isomerase [Verrucomicrobiae bacterium]
MTRRLLRVLLAVVGVCLCALLMGMAATTDNPPPAPGRVTYYKDVLPILQSNCQSCHRPGEIAPWSFMTYEETRPLAAAIKLSVLTRKMPPWYADPQYGHFANVRQLTPQQIRTLVSWAEGGALAGDTKDQPTPVKFLDGWNIGQPDRVVEMPTAFHVPAEGTIDYQYIVIPGGFAQDTWVTAAEIRPGNRTVVHHVIAFVRPPGSKWLQDAQPGVPYVPKKAEDRKSEDGQSSQQPKKRSDEGSGGNEQELLVGYAPGLQPTVLHDSATFIKAGSDLVLQMHYTASGTEGMDKTKIGLIFAKSQPQHRHITLLAPNRSFVIPPNADNYEVRSQVLLEETVTLTDLMPHMHFRGKDFLYKVIYPTGETETLLSVPNYDFNWQMGYDLAKPIVLPKGTRIECTAHFDNSINNSHNPDPTSEVKWGDQTWQEMMIGWFGVSVDPKASTARLIKFEKPGTRTPPGQADAKQPEAKPTSAPGRPAGSSLQ